MAKYSGSKLGDGTPLNVAVYKAYRNAGLSHTQALAVTAEVGRENGFNAGTLFGNHIDPAPNKKGGTIRNLGMLSWNQGRDNQLERHLKQKGVMSNGRMAQTQANLNAQAQFSVQEMKSPTYKGKLKNFWNNPNASPETYARELGKNYIVWAYGQDTIRGKVPGTRQAFDWKSHDVRRRNHLNTLSGMLGGDTNYSATPEQPTWQAPQWQAQEVQAWQPPSWQAPPKSTFTAPKWQKQPEPTFTAPEWQDPENTFTAPEWQSADAEQAPPDTMADNEPSSWQAPEWQQAADIQPQTSERPELNTFG